MTLDSKYGHDQLSLHFRMQQPLGILMARLFNNDVKVVKCRWLKCHETRCRGALRTSQTQCTQQLTKFPKNLLYKTHLYLSLSLCLFIDFDAQVRTYVYVPLVSSFIEFIIHHMLMSTYVNFDEFPRSISTISTIVVLKSEDRGFCQ